MHVILTSDRNVRRADNRYDDLPVLDSPELIQNKYIEKKVGTICFLFFKG